MAGHCAVGLRMSTPPTPEQRDTRRSPRRRGLRCRLPVFHERTSNAVRRSTTVGRRELHRRTTPPRNPARSEAAALPPDAGLQRLAGKTTLANRAPWDGVRLMEDCV